MEKAHAAWQQAEARWTGEIVQALQARAKALAQRGDSRSLLMAAYITRAAEGNRARVGQKPDEAQARQLYLQAARPDAGQAADALALAMAGDWCRAKSQAMPCRREEAAQPPECDAQALFKRLTQQEPDNGAAWLLLAGASPEGSDERQQALQRAADAPQMRFYELDAGRQLHEVFRSVNWPPLPPDWARLVPPGGDAPTEADARRFHAALPHLYATGAYAAVAFVDLAPFHRMCGATKTNAKTDAKADEAARAPLRRDQCRAIAARVAAEPDNSMLRRLLALKMLIKLTEGEPQQARWREQLRQMTWLQQGNMSDLSLLDDPAAFDLTVPEEQLMCYRLRLVGLPETPPADWVPEDRLAWNGE